MGAASAITERVPLNTPVATNPTATISDHQFATGADALATDRYACFMISTVARLCLTSGTVR